MRYGAQLRDLGRVCAVYTDLVLSDEVQLILELLGRLLEYLSHFMRAGLLDVLAHLEDEVYMPPVLVIVSITGVSAFLLGDLNVLFDVDELIIDTINLLLPFKRINPSLKYALLKVIRGVIKPSALRLDVSGLLRVEEIDFSFFCGDSLPPLGL